MAVADRSTFLDERRRLAPIRMDRLFAPDYDSHWGEIGRVHRTWLSRFLDLVAPGDEVLDAACGTGIHWPQIHESGRRVFGIDHSRGMLEHARRKFPEVETAQLRLQDLCDHPEFRARFSGLTCIDAMENVFPEDWPAVLDGFAGVLRPGAPAYLTVELPDAGDRDALADPAPPLVTGEVVWEDEHGGGYHYYPAPEQAVAWLERAGFTVLDETDGDGDYHHLLASTAPKTR